MSKMRTLSISSLFLVISSNATAVYACTSGWAMGPATVDGRPILWYNNDQSLSERKPKITKYTDYICVETKYKQGLLNKYGLAKANNNVTFNRACDYGPSWGQTTIGSLRNSLEKRDYDVGTWLAVIDGNGNACGFEVGDHDYWEYNPLDSSRQKNPDYDFSNPNFFGVRANRAFVNRNHQELDAAFNTWNNENSETRYSSARNLFNTYINNSDKLTVEEVLKIARNGNPGMERYGLCSIYNAFSDIVLGVKKGEDTKYTTMLAALGMPDYSVFVPVWYTLSQANLSPHVKSFDASSIGYWSYRLFEDKIQGSVDAGDDDYVNQLFADLQKNIVDGVKAARSKWFSKGDQADFSNSIKEMHQQSAWCAYTSMRSAYNTINNSTDRGCNDVPTIISMKATPSGPNRITCSANASDKHGISQYAWKFGDGSPSASGANQSHTYSKPGTYMVSLIVKDKHSSIAANVMFKWVTVDGASGESVAGTGGQEDAIRID